MAPRTQQGGGDLPLHSVEDARTYFSSQRSQVDVAFTGQCLQLLMHAENSYKGMWDKSDWLFF